MATGIEEIVVRLKPELDKAAASKAGTTLEDALNQSLGKVGDKFVGGLSKSLGGIDLAPFVEAFSMDALMGPIGLVVAGLTLLADGVVMVAGATLELGKFAIDSSIEVAHLGTEISRSAAKAEMGTRDFQVFAQAAKETGVNMHQLTNGIKMMNKNAFEAALNPASKMAASFKMMGMEVTGLDGKLKKPEVLLKELMGQFSNFERGSAKAAEATRLLGIRGHELTPFLEKGPKYLDELTKRMDEYGNLMSDSLIKDSLEFTQATNDLAGAWQGVKNRLADLGVLKALTWVIEQATLVIDWFSQGLKQMKEYTEQGHYQALLLESTFGVLVVTAGALAAIVVDTLVTAFQLLWEVMKPVANLFIAFGLVIDDFVAYMNGAPSVIGDMLKEFNKFKDLSFLDSIKEIVHIIDTLQNINPWAEAWAGIRHAFFDPFFYSLHTLGTLLSAVGMTSLGSAFSQMGDMSNIGGNQNSLTSPKNLTSALTGPDMYSNYMTPASSNSFMAGDSSTTHNKVDITINASTTATAEEVAAQVHQAFEFHTSNAQQAVK